MSRTRARPGGEPQGESMRSAGSRPTIGDIAFETLFSAAWGGSVIAFFFAIVDMLAGQPLHTPSVIGQVLLPGRPVSTEQVDLYAVAFATGAHLAAFFVLGLVASLLVRRLDRWHGGVVVATCGVFLLMEVPAFIATGVLRPGLGAEIGHGMILTANALAAVAMAIFLEGAHKTAAAPLRTRP